MIVDDSPANLRLLEEMLRRQGHEVHSFPRGRLALAEAERNPPDLILLDINMPEMNGYEVCERLKSMLKLAAIPVIFLSALNETEDKVKAFRSGAADYISKPFQFEEVHARVETHLKLHELQQALQRQNEHLEETVAARTRELADAHRRLTIVDRSKGDFLKLISHELRTPLNGILGIGQLAVEQMPFSEFNGELQLAFEKSRRRILAILDDGLLLTEIDVGGDQFKSGPVSLHAVLSRAVESTTVFASSRQVALTLPPPNQDVIAGEENLLVRALRALLETAVKFSGCGETVRLSNEIHGDSLHVTIESHGKTIPPATMPIFFDLLAIAESSTPGGDLGLGPAVAHRILALFGASVTVENRDPSGIRLTVSLRRAAKHDVSEGATAGAT
jgi:two-component system, sensor histidine kinase and response regulator